MSRTTKFCLAHSAVALVLGLLFYLFTRQHTYLHAILQISGTPQLRIGALAGWLGDFLWSYALCFALYPIWREKKGILIAVIGTLALGVLLEILQKAHVIRGTFDLLDIFAEAVAAFTAAIIIKKRSIAK